MCINVNYYYYFMYYLNKKLDSIKKIQESEFLFNHTYSELYINFRIYTMISIMRYHNKFNKLIKVCLHRHIFNMYLNVMITI